MNEILEFLQARLDEDEQTATAAISATFGGDSTWTSKDDGTGRQTHGYVMADHTAICGHDDDDVLLPIADHIARYDPARVLREVEAKRRVLADYELYKDAKYPDSDGGHAMALEVVLDLLAAVYSDHADYREEWAVD